MKKKKDSKGMWIFYLGIILFIIAISLSCISFYIYGEKITTYTDCYDRFGNKILNQVCEEEVNTIEEPGSFLSALGAVLLLISSIMIAWSLISKNIWGLNDN